ncbi:MAG: 50S ribosomal protein L32 [Armatimonadetes bacterium]|nr:50S ribosomal protein L32 [Armatimonadota bacterium]HOC31178.1 50S ribosomal protein L32 [Armatimonadota bacterium]
MPLPKRKGSRSARGQRRSSNWQIKEPALGKCNRCHAWKLMHHACPSCGFYNGRRVLVVKDRTKKEE